MKKHFLAVLFLAVPAGVAAWIIGDKSTQCAEWRHYEAIKDDIRDKLKSPSTAEFAPLSAVTWQREDRLSVCVYDAAGYVDAQNSFGATIRQDFTARTVGGRGDPKVTSSQISSR